MIGVLGHGSALVRLYWGGDNMGLLAHVIGLYIIYKTGILLGHHGA